MSKRIRQQPTTFWQLFYLFYRDFLPIKSETISLFFPQIVKSGYVRNSSPSHLLAAVLANILAILNAYIFHKFVTFRSPLWGLAMIPEFVRFFSMYLFSIFLGLVLLPVFVEFFHLDPKIAGALLIPITVIISYLGHSRFSFRQDNQAHHS